MEVRKPTAVMLIVVSLAGVGGKLTMEALDHTGHDASMIAHDVGGLSGGTILHEQERGGFAALDTRHPVELRRPYHGGCAGDYL